MNPIQLREMICDIWAKQVHLVQGEIADLIGITPLTLRKIMQQDKVKLRTKTILLINNWYNKHKEQA